MAIAFYMDEQVPTAITLGLRRLGVDVLRIQDDGHDQTDDEVILDRAGAIGRVVFTQDDDFLSIAHRRQTTGMPFSGVVYAKQGVPVGVCIKDLELISVAYVASDMENKVEYLPL